MTLAAALLHDAVEDTSVTIDDLVTDFGPDLTAIVDGVTTLDAIVGRARAPWRFGAWVFTLFALTATALTAVGPFSVAALDVAERREEPETRTERHARAGMQAGSPHELHLGAGLGDPVGRRLQQLRLAAPCRSTQEDDAAASGGGVRGGG